MRAVSTLAMILLAGAYPCAVRAEPAWPLHGRLVPGPHPVGVTRLTFRDPQRPVGPDRVANESVPLQGRARTVSVDVWYPAVTTAPPLAFADYLVAHLPPEADAAARTTRLASRVDDLRRQLTAYGTVDEPAFKGLLGAPMLAVRDAPPAAGPFPLIVGQLRPVATVITSEHLASHGYVVAFVSADDPDVPDAGRGLERAVRDMELTIAELRTRPWVDQAALGTLGFSGAGFSQVLLAMRHPDVDAVCDLESAIFDDRVMWPLDRGWGYDVSELRVPFLHTYSVPLSKRENRLADFEAMRYSLRYHYLVDAPGITHADFATQGMVASVMPGLRGPQAARLQVVFETTNRYVRAFFDAHVKRDPAGTAFLAATPTANGVPDGLVSVRVLPPVVPAPSPEAFTAAIRAEGLDVAMRALHEGRARDPGAHVYRERTLNALGYRFFREGKMTESLAILRAVVEWYPTSPNAYDSLSEVLESAGQKLEARAVVVRGLEVAAAPGVSPGDREAFTRMLTERLARLGAS